ncbi:MAG TPA: tetratricopeptide repeat protein [Treponemataceae bacterium]|nr:tetratricopeptide repeat protein [Treponemataceae bacterium]
MPGIKQLEKFRQELSSLGNEREVTTARGEVYEEYVRPSEILQEPPAVNIDDLLSSIDDARQEEKPSIAANDKSNETDRSDFDDLLASLSLDELTDDPIATNPVDRFDSVEEVDEIDEESFSVPNDLLAGFADDIEDARKDASSGEFPLNEDVNLEDLNIEDVNLEPPVMADVSSMDPDSFDIDSFEIPDFDNTFPSTPAATGEDLEDFGMPEPIETLDDFADFDSSSNIEPLDSFDLSPEVDFPTDSEFSGELDLSPGSDMSLDDFLSEKKAPEAPNPFGDEFKDFTIPDDLDLGSSESAVDEPSELDGFYGFSLDEDILPSSVDSALAEGDEFHIPGFSDFTSTPGRPALSELPYDLPELQRTAKKAVRLEISETEFQRFLENLALLPLNLRIAIEEYISGDDGSEIQKMEVVHSVLNDVPLRKIARTLETALDRSIPIPKDFEKRNFAQYQQEKSSLRYVFFNKILPIAVGSILLAILAGCVFFLSWQFIYKPLAAEQLYKRGYQAIADERYIQAINLFNEATQVWEKKNWYFKYARALRDKKQYISAEQMYLGLLARYKKDLQAGLEYAQMLKDDLRNYSKAEQVIRRRILDNFVNNREGLLLLGDTYLDWAEEDSSKYEAARLTYASLLELYGREDPYLARMMRYFIRTDNLAEVLPLKDYFMNKRKKIESSDLVELSGYLLDKRYNPKRGESDFLRNQIEDVRALLDRAIKADPMSPEAHYNSGRYFIYNYRSAQATASLESALQTFASARYMTPRRVLKRVDTYRLLGELLVESREYLDARKMYSDGISLYREHQNTRSVKGDPFVGKLYADYADIDYFISNNFDSALENYRLAVQEGWDTASVRYRIGYINYRQQDYRSAIDAFIMTHAEKPQDRNLLFGFANTLFRRGDFNASQGYFERLQEMLEAERIRKGILFPQVRTDHGEFVQMYMQNANNLGVTLNRLASRTGDSRQNGRSLALFAESSRAWDALTRNPETLVRAQGSNLAYLNMQNITRPTGLFVPEIYSDIPKTLENEKVLQQRVDQ